MGSIEEDPLDKKDCYREHTITLIVPNRLRDLINQSKNLIRNIAWNSNQWTFQTSNTSPFIKLIFISFPLCLSFVFGWARAKETSWSDEASFQLTLRFDSQLQFIGNRALIGFSYFHTREYKRVRGKKGGFTQWPCLTPSYCLPQPTSSPLALWDFFYFHATSQSLSANLPCSTWKETGFVFCFFSPLSLELLAGQFTLSS